MEGYFNYNSRFYIDSDNYGSYIGSEVRVEICCKEYGVAHPEDNILLDFKDNCWYFKSIEDNQEWKWPVNSTDNCSIDVFIDL